MRALAKIRKKGDQDCTTPVIGYYDYRLMTHSFSCFISFQGEKRVLGCERCFVYENARFPFVVSPVFSVALPVYPKMALLPNDYYDLVTCPEVVTISDNQCIKPIAVFSSY